MMAAEMGSMRILQFQGLLKLDPVAVKLTKD
jgi:hypothetical protein